MNEISVIKGNTPANADITKKTELTFSPPTANQNSKSVELTQSKRDSLNNSCGTFIMDPPTTMPMPNPLDTAYFRQSTSLTFRFSTNET